MTAQFWMGVGVGVFALAALEAAVAVVFIIAMQAPEVIYSWQRRKS